LKKHERLSLKEARANQKKLRIADIPEHLILPKNKWGQPNKLSRQTIDKTAAIIGSPRQIHQKRISVKLKESSQDEIYEEYKQQRPHEVFDQKEVFDKEKRVFQGISPFARANKKRLQRDIVFDRY
jgi:hypothetical protein